MKTLRRRRREHKTDYGKRIKLLKNFAFTGLIAATVVAFHVHIIPRPSYRLLDEAISDKIISNRSNPHYNFLYPPRIWNIDYQKDYGSGMTAAFKNIIIQEHAGNFVYYRPQDSKVCWNSPLPCAPAKLKNVELLQPETGIKGGFEKINSDSDIK